MRVLGSGHSLSRQLDLASSRYLTSNQAIRVGACWGLSATKNSRKWTREFIKLNKHVHVA